jgi:hypothetical protein
MPGEAFWLDDGPESLDDLVDVDTSSSPPTDGQALVFDAGSGLWAPRTVSSGGGGGGGGGELAWNLVLDNPLTSTTGFTATGGTWDTSSGAYVQASGGGAYSLRWNTLLTSPWVFAEVDVGSGTRYAGLSVGADGVGHSLLGRYQHAAGVFQVQLERQGVVAIQTSAWPGGAFDAWRRLGLLVAGGVGTIYDEGRAVRAMGRIDIDLTHQRLHVLTHDGNVRFRNLKVWQLDPGLPT